MKVAVYGTLKRGYGNNRLLEGAAFLEESVIDGYKLFYSYKSGNSFGFPVAKADPNSCVVVELFEIPEGELGEGIVASLDRLESKGFMYDRVEVMPDVHMYVGCDGAWDWDNLEECPNEDSYYMWSRLQFV